MSSKISVLPAVGAASGTDVFPIVQGGANFKESNTQVATWLASPGFTALNVNTAGLISTALIRAQTADIEVRNGIITTFNVSNLDGKITNGGGGYESTGIINLGPGVITLNPSTGLIASGTIGTGGIIALRDLGGDDTITLDGTVHKISVGNTVGDLGTVDVSDGTSQTAIQLDGSTATVYAGSGTNIPDGKVLIRNSIGAAVSLSINADGFTVNGGSIEILAADPAGYILRSPDGTRWKINIDNGGNLSTGLA